jgi:hypothetical protein
VFDGLKLIFRVEINIRNSKIAVRMLYGEKLNAVTQQNLKTSDSFNARLKLFSVTPSFLTGNRHLLSKVPTIVG